MGKQENLIRGFLLGVVVIKISAFFTRSLVLSKAWKFKLKLDKNYSKKLNSDLNGKTIGIPKEYTVDGISDEINAVWDDAIKSLEKKGATIKHISLPHTKYALPTYYIIAPAEASSNLAR